MQNTSFQSFGSGYERGGTFLGIVIGLVLGLGAALAVAIYVTKVPVPFVNKGISKNSAEQDAQEAQKTKIGIQMHRSMARIRPSQPLPV